MLDETALVVTGRGHALASKLIHRAHTDQGVYLYATARPGAAPEFGLRPPEREGVPGGGVRRGLRHSLAQQPARTACSPVGTDNQVPAETAAIAVELVSPSNPENDWVGKVRDYPVMGIPLYLVVDARLKTVTLFSRPERGTYRRREDFAFGETVRVPAPFGFELDTAELIPYG